MPRMSERNRAAPDGGTDAAPSTALASVGGTGAPLGRYSVPVAARRLGISERAVRKRIEAKSLLAVRDGRAWVVLLPGDQGGAGEHPLPPSPEPTAAPPIVDLAPLADLIDHLRHENRQLAEAAAVWQVRALQAEERVKQLTAGTVAPPPAEGAATEPRGDLSHITANEPTPRPWWKRRLGLA